MPRRKLDPFDTRVPDPLIDVDQKTLSDLTYYIMDEQRVTRDEAMAQARQILKDIESTSEIQLLTSNTASSRLKIVCCLLPDRLATVIRSLKRISQTMSDIPVRDLDINPMKQERSPISEAREENNNRSKRKRKKKDNIEEDAGAGEMQIFNHPVEFPATPSGI